MSTSKLQRKMSRLLSIHFGGFTIRENYRPDWLITPAGQRLELDFYIEELKAAIEVQGEQHYKYTPGFHADYSDFTKQLERDKCKSAICLQYGIELIYVSSDTDALDAIDELNLFIPGPGQPTTIAPMKYKRPDQASFQFKRYAKSLRRELKKECPRENRVEKLKGRIVRLISRHDIDSDIIKECRDILKQD